MPNLARRVACAVAIAVLALTAGLAAVRAEEARAIAEKLAAIRDAAADRELRRIEKLVDEFDAAGAGPDALDEARLLLGKTRLLAGRLDEAVRAVDAVVERTASPWSVKALYLTAEAAARRRGFKEAADVYARRVEWGASDEHKAEIAALYREIADGAFEGDTVVDGFGRERKVPDWATARRFYMKARATIAAEKDRALLAYRIGAAALESGDPAAAVAEWQELLRAGAGEWADDATYGLGRAEAALGRRAKARDWFEKVRTEYADGPYAPLALIRIGETWQPLVTRSEEELDRVVAAWSKFVELYPSHEEARAVAWRTAELLLDFGRPREAIERHRAFLAKWPAADEAPVAQDHVAVAFLRLGDFDQAVKEWQALLAKWPNHALGVAAPRRIAEASFAKGRIAFDEKRDADAAAALTSFLAAFPGDPQAPTAQLLLGDIAARAGKLAEAVDAWRLVASKYPDSREAPAALLRVASAYEGTLADLEKALAAYEEVTTRWPGSAEANEARGVLVQMKGRSLEARIARPFRTDEKPQAALRLRNVKSLRMKAYRVRPDEYVQRRGGLAGVEQVDVDVVKPDFAWDFAVPDFAKYRLLDRAAPLPFDKPGAYIVTAAEEELTATFLVVISDITAILKSAPGQALVFAWDERMGEPVPGLEVRLLDGDVHGVTGADGVWKSDDTGASGARALVLGTGPHAGHFAYVGGAAASAAAFGYTTKVFLATDRPVYRPGDSVHLRGIVRRVTDGRYVAEKDLPTTVRVVDPRGAVLYESRLPTDEFGTFADEFALAAEPSLGTYRISAELDGRTFTRQFDVLAYHKPDVFADVTPEKRAYLVGDRVKAAVSLRFAVGGVVAGATTKWSVYRGPFAFDPSVHQDFAWFFTDPVRDEERRRRTEAGTELFTRGEGTTDADGRLAIEFATETVEEDRTYTIVVEAQDPNRRWVSTSCSVPVARQSAYSIVRTERKLYRPGEKLRLEITTVDALHAPVALAGRAVLVRRRVVAEHFVEDEVASSSVTTDSAGRAVVDLAGDKPGDHVAKFVAKDAHGRDVVGAVAVTLAGDAEDLAKVAKIVADRDFYREGDVARVLVNVPVAPCPVLVTYEGERVLGWRVVMAKERSSTIELPLSAEHAPNVFLRMAAAKAGALYEDGDEVAVFQYLDVAVSAEPGEVKPGGKVRLSVRATDQSGRPVRAELGVDVVDSAIDRLAADGTPQIKPFFYDQRRTHAVTSAASVGAMPSVTRPTNKDLLFEQMRRLGKEQFAAMQEHVRLGRELLEKGDREHARDELALALEIAPGNYEARSMLESLEEMRRQEADVRKRPESAALAGSARGDAPNSPAAARPSEERAAGDKSKDEKVEELKKQRRGGRAKAGAVGGGGDAGREDESAGEPAANEVARDRDGAEVAQSAADAATGFVADAKEAGAFLNLVRLAQAASPLIPPELRRRFADTATSESVRTGDDGVGRLEVELPDNLTEWRVTARGASAGPLVGEGRTSFRTVKRILVRPDAPRFLVEGDTTTATGTVHSSLETEVDLAVRFAAEGLRPSPSGAELERRARLGPGEVRPFEIVLVGDARGIAKVRVEALSAVESDAAELGLPILPYGMRRMDGASGTLVEEAFVELELPEGAVPGTASLTVTLSPSLDVSLLESLAFTTSYPWGCVEQTVDRFLPALAARRVLDALSSPNERLKKTCDEAVVRGLAALYALQNDDGSFGWFGRRARGAEDRGAGGDPEMTAYAVLGYVRAEQAGFHVSTSNRDRAIAAARNLVHGAAPEHRAFLLYALSFAQQADLADLNALFRDRASLSTRGLALLSLSMRRTGRPSLALDAAHSFAERAVRANGTAHWDADGAEDRRRWFAWAPRDAEPTAYALLALLAVEPANPLVDEAASWLVSSRRGPAWRSTRDTAVAIEALAEWMASRGVERAHGDVEIYVGDAAQPAATTTFGGTKARPVDSPVSVELPATALKPGKNRVVLRRRGQGRVHWSALLAAVVRPAEGKTIEAGGALLEVSRDYTAWFAPPLEGETRDLPIAPGYEVVVAEQRPAGWRGRPLALAGTGDKVRVKLRLRAPQRVERVILEDPLPAGFEVVQGGAEGPFDREERRDDRQAFFFSAVHGEVEVSYVLQAVHPGEYRALPASARPMYEPEIHGWSRENRLVVQPEPGLAGRAPAGEEITPDEIHGFAVRAFARRDWGSARRGFEGLVGRWKLVPSVEVEVWRSLFAIGVETGDARLLVKAYEQVVDRDPRWSPPGLRERRALADAYNALDEHERALTIYRDVERENFAADKEAALAFAEIGNPWRAGTLLAAALRREPDVGWEEAEELALARATMDLRAPTPETGAKRRVPRTSDAMPPLLTDAVRMFRAFCAHHAASDLAHEAGFLAVQSLLKMRLPAEAIAEGTKFMARFPKSRYLDDATYLVAEGHFQAGDHDAALAAAKPLLTRTYPRDDDPNVADVSPFRANAVHLTAKIAHLRGELARAVDLYRSVESLFPDARDAREFLTRRELTLGEVESVAVGGTPRLHLARKNVPEVRLKVYAVDFMILYALRRDLSAVNRIDLAGVEPVKEWVVARKGAEDFRRHEEEVELPAKEKGVYLVVAKGGGIDASSVVLVSDLEVAVQETDGKMRVYASDRRTGLPMGEVYVKVGNGSTIGAQGFTDARGVFEAGAAGAGASVVAEKDGNVALWRR